jgi:hypothetical protein
MVGLLPFVAGFAILLLIPREASAYLDPGTGSYMLQLALAGLFASMVTLKLYWQRIKDWFRGTTKPAAPEHKDEHT